MNSKNKLFKACEHCFSRKIRCVRDSDTEKCRKCTKLNIPCNNRTASKKVLISKDSVDKHKQEIAMLKKRLQAYETPNQDESNSTSSLASYRSSTSAVRFHNDIHNVFSRAGLIQFNDYLLKHDLDFTITPGNNFILPDRQYTNTKLSIAYKTLCFDYHLMAPKRTSKIIEEIYNGDNDDSIELVRLLFMISFGELYDIPNTKHGNEYPGLKYFKSGISLLESIKEEPSLSYIEVSLLASLYLNTLNCLKRSYIYVGKAIRLAILLGLNDTNTYNDTSIPDFERERMKRVWWTAFILDVFLSSNLGFSYQPTSSFVTVGAPNKNDDLDMEYQGELSTAFFLSKRITLAKINVDIIGLSYKSMSPDNLITNTVSILASLRKFYDNLLLNSRNIIGTTELKVFNRSTVSLKLRYNECILLATRDFFFMVFRGNYSQTVINEGEFIHIFELAETCMQSALTNFSIIHQLFIDKDISYFGYFDVYFLFSATTIILIANNLEYFKDYVRINGVYDLEIATKDSLNILKSMKDFGNVSSGYFYDSLIELQNTLQHTNKTDVTTYDLDIDALEGFLQDAFPGDIQLDPLTNDIFLQ